MLKSLLRFTQLYFHASSPATDVSVCLPRFCDRDIWGTLTGILLIWYKHSLGFLDELIRSEVKDPDLMYILLIPHITLREWETAGDGCHVEDNPVVKDNNGWEAERDKLPSQRPKSQVPFVFLNDTFSGNCAEKCTRSSWDTGEPSLWWLTWRVARFMLLQGGASADRCMSARGSDPHTWMDGPGHTRREGGQTSRDGLFYSPGELTCRCSSSSVTCFDSTAKTRLRQKTFPPGLHYRASFRLALW